MKFSVKEDRQPIKAIEPQVDREKDVTYRKKQKRLRGMLIVLGS